MFSARAKIVLAGSPRMNQCSRVAPTACWALGLRLCQGDGCVVGFSFLAVILLLPLVTLLPHPLSPLLPSDFFP